MASSSDKHTTASAPNNDASTPADKENAKGKGKGKDAPAQDHAEDTMDEDDNDDDEEEEEEDDDDDDDEDEDEDEDMDQEPIDPSVILPRRTRGARVDYTSPEALAKAGLKQDELNDDDE